MGWQQDYSTSNISSGNAFNFNQMDKIPDTKELEKELSEYLSKKYGNRITVLAPQVIAKPEKEGEEPEKGGKLASRHQLRSEARRTGSLSR